MCSAVTFHLFFFFFFFNDTATTEIYTLSLHDALPISYTVSGEPEPEYGHVWFPDGVDLGSFGYRCLDVWGGCGDCGGGWIGGVLLSSASGHARRSDGRSEVRVKEVGECDPSIGFTRFHCGCGRCFAGRRRTRNWTTSCATTWNEKQRNTSPKGWRKERRTVARDSTWAVSSRRKRNAATRDARTGFKTSYTICALVCACCGRRRALQRLQ